MNEQPRKPRFIMPEFFSDEEEQIKEEVKPEIKTTVEVKEPIIEEIKVVETPIVEKEIRFTANINNEVKEESYIPTTPIPEIKPVLNNEEQKRIEEELTKKTDDLVDLELYNLYAPKEEVPRYKSRRNSLENMPLYEEPKEKIVNMAPELKLEEENTNNDLIQDEIEKILNIENLDEILVPIEELSIEEQPKEEKYSYVDLDESTEVEITKENLVEKLSSEAALTNKETIIGRYGEDFTTKNYITNPAIGRSEEIKQLILILLTPEKSAILVGKPGIGKTSIVEGLSYAIQRNNVPDVLKGYTIVNVKTSSLLGTLPSGETRLQTLVDELKKLDKVILFIDEIHMLIGSTNDSAMDFANMFKESLGRGSIKVIGATTTEEYERYILRDKAFVRRFQQVEILEPDKEQTVKILMGTLPKIEKNTKAKLKYSSFMQKEIMGFIVDITSEFKRIYGIGSRYPDICITLLSQAYSQAVFEDRHEVTIYDVRNAIENSKNIYPDVIRKELVNFDIKFKDLINEERGVISQ